MQNPAINPGRRILRGPEVEQKVGLDRVTIWRRERAGQFPQRVRIGPNSVGWYSDEIEAFLESLPRVAGGAA
jgi:prophage regulatory protein